MSPNEYLRGADAIQAKPLSGRLADWVEEEYDAYRAKAHTHDEAVRLAARRTGQTVPTVEAYEADRQAARDGYNPN